MEFELPERPSNLLKAFELFFMGNTSTQQLQLPPLPPRSSNTISKYRGWDILDEKETALARSILVRGSRMMSTGIPPRSSSLLSD